MALVQPQSDIAALWEEALNDYKKVTDIDMRSRLNVQRSVNSIMVTQNLIFIVLTVIGLGISSSL
jgi:hypothetical protein